MLNTVAAAFDTAIHDENFLHLDPLQWAQLEDQSIDYAILEKTDAIRCLKFAGSWSDLGDWNALANQLQLDASDNLVSGDVSQIDCKNVTLWAVSRENTSCWFGAQKCRRGCN